MKVTQKARQYWHDLYYSLAGDRGVAFAMTCKEVTSKIDLTDKRNFRFWLHLSLCQACKNYLKLTQALRKGAQSFSKNSKKPIDVNRLNKDLLNKFSNKGH